MSTKVVMWWEKLLGHWCNRHNVRKIKLFTSVEKLGQYEWVCGYCDSEQTKTLFEARQNGTVIPGVKYWP